MSTWVLIEVLETDRDELEELSQALPAGTVESAPLGGNGWVGVLVLITGNTTLLAKTWIRGHFEQKKNMKFKLKILGSDGQVRQLTSEGGYTAEELERFLSDDSEIDPDLL